MLMAAVTSSWYRLADWARLCIARAQVRELGGERVSVPIATYDRIDVLLQRTVPALLQQTHQDIEIIVVGDGTPRPLWSQVEAFAHPRVKTRRLKKRTRYPQDPLSLWMVAGWRARNLGARMVLTTVEF